MIMSREAAIRQDDEGTAALSSTNKPSGRTEDDSALRPWAIEAQGLGLDYGSQSAFRGVDLQVPRGEITALVGPSGCGKTSFLHSVNRLTDLLPGARLRGRLRFEDIDVLAPSTDVVALRRRIGLLSQSPNPFPMSIRANLHLALREHGVRSKKQRDEISRRALEETGLWEEVADRLDASAFELSGGQQQRLCLARALTLEPELLLMDEPCSALDPLSSATVEALIERLRGRYTILLVTHNLAQARRLADSVALFWREGDAGRLVEHSRTEEFFERPKDPRTADYVQGRRG